MCFRLCGFSISYLSQILVSESTTTICEDLSKIAYTGMSHLVIGNAFQAVRKGW